MLNCPSEGQEAEAFIDWYASFPLWLGVSPAAMFRLFFFIFELGDKYSAKPLNKYYIKYLESLQGPVKHHGGINPHSEIQLDLRATLLGLHWQCASQPWGSLRLGWRHSSLATIKTAPCGPNNGDRPPHWLKAIIPIMAALDRSLHSSEFGHYLFGSVSSCDSFSYIKTGFLGAILQRNSLRSTPGKTQYRKR